LLDKGESVSLRALESQVRARDERDTNREVSPLVAADDAIEIDTSELSIDEVLDEVLNIVLLKGLM
jgi:cytidylate kinase